MKSGKAAGYISFPLLLLYKSISAVRYLLYKYNVIKSYSAGCPVISIGNIEMGGGGKTPFLIWLAERLLERGFKVVVVSRGYKRSDESEEIVVDPESADNIDPARAGDEPAMIFRRIPNLPIILNADRAAAAGTAVKKFKPDVILLDDGFQHHRLKRTLDIIVVPSRRSAWRREFRCALKRADLIIYTEGSIPPKIKGAPAFAMKRYLSHAVKIAGGERENLSFFKNKKITAVAGIANPEQFFRMLEDAELNIQERIPLTDHYIYSDESIRDFENRAEKTGCEYILTTEKDAVKIERLKYSKHTWYSAALDIEIPDETELLNRITSAIN